MSWGGNALKNLADIWAKEHNAKATTIIKGNDAELIFTYEDPADAEKTTSA